ncbi:MAG: hypothetical protein M1455_06330 [Actinobacteria bacterium]|nr:hypothetical protein [Actinomycetota bacterium]
MTFGPKHEGCRRQFIQLSRAYYGAISLATTRDVTDEIQVGFYHPDGGTSGEFSIVWIALTCADTVPRLEAFNDSWDALWQFRDVLEKMAAVDGQNISPDDFCRLLESCGVEDATPVERAYS